MSDLTKRILCLGAGGHAAVVIDLLQRLRSLHGGIKIVGLVTSETNEPPVLGVPIVGGDMELPALVASFQASHFVIGIGSVVGGNPLRNHLFQKARSAGLEPYTAIHPAATVAESAIVGAGTQVMAGVVIQPRTRLGRNVIINTMASIDHDCEVGDHAHLAPGVICSGGVRIEAGAHIGTGAVLIQGVRVGMDATVGAGSTVIDDCPDGEVVVGNPARPVRREKSRDKQ